MRRRLLIHLVLIPFIVGILVVLLASSETALQWAARRVTAASGGTVTVTGVSGSLARTLRIERIRHQTPERIVTVENAELTWSPSQLLYDRVAIDVLAASAVTVENLQPSGKPPTLPLKLGLPLDLLIDEARVGTIAFIHQDERTELHNVRFRLSGDDKQWQLQDLSVETAFGTIGGSATLGNLQPFPIEASLQLARADANASAVVGGTLSELLLDANFSGFGAVGQAKAVATPFDAFMLRSLVLNASGIDPSKVQADWPKADMKIAVDAGFSPDGLLQGGMVLGNSLAGPLDRQLLPLLSARAQLGGTLDAARLDGVVLDFGSAGKFSGSGSTTGSEGALTLHTDRFDLKGISGRMNSTRIAGDIVLASKDGMQTLDAKLGQDRLRMDLNAVKEGSMVRLQQAILRTGNGEARVAGELNLTDVRPFKLEGAMRRFNPAAFGTYPAADLNLNYDLQGQLAPQWQVAVRYEVQPSRLFNQPLSGKGRFSADPKHVRGLEANLALGPNTASASGDFGLPGDRLKWRVDAPRLAAFGIEYQGSLKGEGELGGSAEAPQFSLLLNGSDLMLHGFGAKTLHASSRFGEGEQGAIQADILLADASRNDMLLQSLRIKVEGTRQAHTVRLSASSEEIDLEAQAAGGWQPDKGWEGTIRTLQNRGKFAFSLQNPARIQAGAGAFSLQDLAINLAGGRVNIATLEKSGPKLSSRGSATGLPLSWLVAFSPSFAESIDTDLTLGADWSLAAGDTVDGNVHVFREAGDITLRGNAATTLGLTALDLRANIARNAVQAEAKVRGERAGNIQLVASTQLAQQNGGWTLPAQSPLRMSANADIPSLAWLGPMSGNPGIDVGGRLNLALTGSGTVGRPQVSGEIAGNDLALRWAEQGINLHGGVLRAQLQGDRLQLQQAAINGDEGTLRLEGGARFIESQLVVDMKLVADKLLLLSRPDRVLAVSGESALSIDQSRLQLTGKLQADRARIEFPDQKSVTLSEDVVVLGQERKQAEARKALPIRYDMELDLGRRFQLKGKGLDARLAGSVRVFSSQAGIPNARGTIRVTEGTYEAYGQKLQIERGLITFNGPINNPSLDILAVRKVSDVENAVEAGVSVRGTALRPVARLVSTPSVTDTEKLSWLVLGKGTDQAGGQEYGVLAAAASALFSTGQAESLQSRLANTFGVDEFGVTNAMGLEEAVVTIGKRISSRVYLTLEQGVGGASSLIKLRYMLSRQLTVEVGTGTRSTVDLIYNWRFD